MGEKTFLNFGKTHGKHRRKNLFLPRLWICIFREFQFKTTLANTHWRKTIFTWRMGISILRSSNSKVQMTVQSEEKNFLVKCADQDSQ